jgi:hypothetical protein
MRPARRRSRRTSSRRSSFSRSPSSGLATGIPVHRATISAISSSVRGDSVGQVARQVLLEVVLAHNEAQVRHVGREQQRGLARRVSAPHRDDRVAAADVRLDLRRGVVHAHPFVLGQIRERQPAIANAGGDHDRAADHGLPIAQLHAERPLGHLQAASVARHGDAGAELRRPWSPGRTSRRRPPPTRRVRPPPRSRRQPSLLLPAGQTLRHLSAPVAWGVRPPAAVGQRPPRSSGLRAGGLDLSRVV